MGSIKPATPLPFEASFVGPDRNGRFKWGIYSDGRQAFAVIGGDKQDAAYITHAANAYPRLVEALKQARTTILHSNAEHIWLNAPNVPEETPITRIDAILREIGEA